MYLLRLFIFLFLLVFVVSCQDTEQQLIADVTSLATSEQEEVKPRVLSEEFKQEWFGGDAEITSYDLSQERYGELRKGTAVTIFVTEDTHPEKQVKADRPSEASIPVLKLNFTKKFVTGIYPYSIMTSTFSPIQDQSHALKVANSVQEWCGQVYAQLNNRDTFEVVSHSYFEKEADQEFSLEKTWLEDELWNRIRLNPEELPIGTFSMIPSLEFTRLRHKELQAYEAIGDLKQRDSLSTYEVAYPQLKRKLVIQFKTVFPFTIQSWEETHANGLKTTAVMRKRMRSPYWSKNGLEDESLRSDLGLE